ncbi:hypothetical protein [Paenibacillus ginsengarvi]|nr:hypothetical protein [Paenibacillus ginsengarvi]
MVYVLQQLNDNGVPPLLPDTASVEQWQMKREGIRRIWMEYLG